ncbi:hypothetical protein [Actinocrispum wychmicini]|uniref:Uncharacterized protein n=1 Tax=Actinocrispum wychmicini TaxID=1213861 RepID=A0A4R2JEF5_9PSEU|nr:hypothetical protein [Actinocrispum wychmicini]TCO58041.1 hypothetical protein EV192_105104 [Actinocrispum wychmicini]
MVEHTPPASFDKDKMRRFTELAMRRLENGPDPLLAEMAREVRSGRMTLIEAAASSAYREAFATIADKATERLRGVDIDTLVAAADDSALDKLIAELEAEPAADDPKPDPPAEDDFDFSAPLAQSQPPPRSASGTPPQRARWKGRRQG